MDWEMRQFLSLPEGSTVQVTDYGFIATLPDGTTKEVVSGTEPPNITPRLNAFGTAAARFFRL